MTVRGDETENSGERSSLEDQNSGTQTPKTDQIRSRAGDGREVVKMVGAFQLQRRSIPAMCTLQLSKCRTPEPALYTKFKKKTTVYP